MKPISALLLIISILAGGLPSNRSYASEVFCMNLNGTGYEIVGQLGGNNYEIISLYTRQPERTRAVLRTKTVTFASAGYFTVDVWVKNSLNPDELPKIDILLKNGFTKSLTLFEEDSECTAKAKKRK